MASLFSPAPLRGKNKGEQAVTYQQPARVLEAGGLFAWSGGTRCERAGYSLHRRGATWRDVDFRARDA